MRTVIKDNASAKQVNLIGLLNPIIDDWSNYRRYVVSKEVYSAVDTAIWQALWKWCCRRHPCKGARWIRARYFHHEGRGTGYWTRYWWTNGRREPRTIEATQSIRRVDGGSSARANLVMVHPVCHQQIHRRGLTVTNLLPIGGFERLEPSVLKGHARS
ncbi:MULTISPECIES: group II intron maturase-specific domain-containing protein [unclassified Paraburkholderia]|uniref:group II intron maturase-specific domain-containing protein n=1 Tax=Paraburkholderia sp. BL23I1N1 TaxID=1938802 RepID=UPI0015F25E22